MLKEAISIIQTEAPSAHFVKSLLEAKDQHPYATSIHVLLARSAQLNEDPRFEEFVRDAAIRTQSRQRLHQFVYEPLRAIEPAISSNENHADEIIEEQIGNDVLTEIQEFADPIISEIPIHKAPKEEPNKLPEKEAPEKFDPDHARIEILERQFLTEVLASGAAIELLGDEIKNDLDDLNLGQNFRAKNSKPELSESEAQNLMKDSSSSAEKIVEQAPKVKVEPKKRSLSGWLNFLEEEQFDSTQDEIKTDLVEDKQGLPSIQDELTTAEDSQAHKNTSTHSVSVKEVADIISNFINNEDQIVPKRAEFFNPAKAAKSSLLDKNDLVTETLASIYAAQGNINKAISTYEKLSLLHPEKSSYFAGLIKKLKQ